MFDFVPNLESSEDVCSLSTFFNLSINSERSLCANSPFLSHFRDLELLSIFSFFVLYFYYLNIQMKDKLDNHSRSLKWERNGELAHKDLSELIERLKNVESEHTSSELARLGSKLNKKD